MSHEGLSYSFDRAETARVAGVSEDQVRNWMDRYKLFPEKRQGRGYHISFGLREIMKLSAVSSLIHSGISPLHACEALDPYSVFGTWLHNPDGLFWLSKNHEGRWVGMHGSGIVVSIVINTHELYVKIRDRLAVEAEGNAELAAALVEWDRKVSAFRKRNQDEPA